jgi:hypothetical protein
MSGQAQILWQALVSVVSRHGGSAELPRSIATMWAWSELCEQTELRLVKESGFSFALRLSDSMSLLAT